MLNWVKKAKNITPKEKIFNHLKKTDPDFKRIIFETLEIYPELKKSFFQESEEFFGKIRLEINFKDNNQNTDFKSISEKYKKNKSKRIKKLIDDKLLDLEDIVKDFPEISNLLEEKSKKLLQKNEKD